FECVVRGCERAVGGYQYISSNANSVSRIENTPAIDVTVFANFDVTHASDRFHFNETVHHSPCSDLNPGASNRWFNLGKGTYPRIGMDDDTHIIRSSGTAVTNFVPASASVESWERTSAAMFHGRITT